VVGVLLAWLARVSCFSCKPSLSVMMFVTEIHDVAQKVEESLKKTKETMKRHWDVKKKEEKFYEEGDLVLVQADYLPSTRTSKKLDDKWRGPFHVIEKKGEAAYELELPSTWKGH
jgi:hypothetical protein